jgi:hypothetical protein
VFWYYLDQAKLLSNFAMMTIYANNMLLSKSVEEHLGKLQLPVEWRVRRWVRHLVLPLALQSVEVKAPQSAQELDYWQAH